MSRDLQYRKAVKQAIEGVVVNVNGFDITVPIYDSKMESDEPIYAILTNQSAIWDGNFHQKQWQCMIEIEVYHRQQDSATYDYIDVVGNEFEERLLADRVGLPSGLLYTSGWEMVNMFLSSANNIKLKEYQGGAGNIALKIMQFTSKILKR